MDVVLNKYLNDLKIKIENYTETKNIRIPDFCETYSNDVREKKILAVLQDPGNSGAEKRSDQQCSLTNNDETANKQREILETINLSPTNVLFWNFYPCFDLNKNLYPYFSGDMSTIKTKKGGWKPFLVKQLEELSNLLPNLSVIMIFGKKAQSGMKHFEGKRNCKIIKAYHPSRRGRIQVVKNGGDVNKYFCEKWMDAKNAAGL